MDADEVVPCARGLTIAQRGAAPDRGSLRVVAVQQVLCPSRPPFEARLADGTLWRRHWDEPERLVVDFVGVVVGEVRDATGEVVFDRPLSAQMEQHLLLDHVLPLVLARAGEVVLHGGVISRPTGAAVLIGSTGAGKSTLTAFAGQRGWVIGGDDGAVLTAGEPPLAEPTYATVRLRPESMELLGLSAAAGSAVLGKTRVRDEQPFHQAPVPLRVIALLMPVPDEQPAAWEPVEGVAAHALLLGATFHADFSGVRLPTVMDGLGAIVETTAVGRLAVPRGADGLAAAERLLRTMVDGAGLLPGAGSSRRSAT